MTILSRISVVFKKYPYLISAALIMIIGGATIFYMDPSSIADEKTHTLQIKRTYKEDARKVEGITNIPGYHYTMAYLGRISEPIMHYENHPKRKHLRLFQLILSLLVPIILFLIVKELNQKKQLTLIVIVTPIIFIYFFVVYTDILALIFFLFAFLLHIKKRYDLAGLLALLSVSVRQDNIIWLGFLIVLLLYETYQKYGLFSRSFIREFISNGATYLITTGIFLIFYIFNGGVAIGDKSAHPSMKLHAENIYLFFAMFTILFLPMIIFKIKDIWKLLSKRWILSLIIIFGGYFIFINTFTVDHPYNLLESDVFVHNVLARLIIESKIIGLVTYGLLVIAVAYIIASSFIEKKYIIIIPFAVLSLSLHWMIEFRYFFIPLILLILTINQSERVMKYQIMYSSIISGILFYYFFINGSVFL